VDLTILRLQVLIRLTPFNLQSLVLTALDRIPLKVTRSLMRREVNLKRPTFLIRAPRLV
jgi:hypothetical protein